ALFRADVPVGPGSAGRRPAVREPRALVLRDARGRVVPHQELSRDVGEDLVEAPGHYPDCDRVEWRRVLFMAEDLPPLGVTHF
ncbi:hypothetical protein, partial [Bacillus altitudinis]|uniref:hypothetical protein n=1 Tax=Bacillus altitudinis TaxID=293387 RepID=UPI002F95DD7B